MPGVLPTKGESRTAIRLGPAPGPQQDPLRTPGGLGPRHLNALFMPRWVCRSCPARDDLSGASAAAVLTQHVFAGLDDRYVWPSVVDAVGRASHGVPFVDADPKRGQTSLAGPLPSAI